MADVTVCDLPDWVIEHFSFLSDIFLGSPALGKATCHIINTLKKPHGDVHRARNYGFLPKDSEELRTSDNSHVSEPSWGQSLQLQSHL